MDTDKIIELVNDDSEFSEEVYDKFSGYFFTDDEKPSRVVRKVTKAFASDKELIDDLFITLCGYSFSTILNEAHKERLDSYRNRAKESEEDECEI